jgi:hypothetical protein
MEEYSPTRPRIKCFCVYSIRERITLTSIFDALCAKGRKHADNRSRIKSITYLRLFLIMVCTEYIYTIGKIFERYGVEFFS